MFEDHIAGNLRRIERHRATLAQMERGTLLNPSDKDRQRLINQIAELEAVNTSVWQVR